MGTLEKHGTYFFLRHFNFCCDARSLVSFCCYCEKHAKALAPVFLLCCMVMSDIVYFSYGVFYGLAAIASTWEGVFLVIRLVLARRY